MSPPFFGGDNDKIAIIRRQYNEKSGKEGAKINPIDFARKAYISADSYYKYLKSSNTGIDIITVYFIKQIKNHLFKLQISKKTPYIEHATIKINSADFPENLEETVKIYEYNENDPSVTVMVSEQYIQAFSTLPPDAITIESDLTFLVSATRDWYRKYHSTILPPPVAKISVKRIPNASATQQRAIETALSSDISYIWGAPGTGKTQFVLANCILSYIKQKKRVLIMAPTNNALEQSLRGVLTILEKNGIDSEKLLRLGRPSHEFSNQYPSSCELQSTEKAIERLKAEIEELTLALKLEQKSAEILSYGKQFAPLYAEYKKLQAPFEKAKNELDTKTVQKIASEQRLDEHEGYYSKTESELRSLTSYQYSIVYKLKSLFSSAHQNDINSQISKLTQKLKTQEKRVESARLQRDQDMAEYEKANAAYQKINEVYSPICQKIERISLVVLEKATSPDELASAFNEWLSRYKNQGDPHKTAELIEEKKKALNDLVSIQKQSYCNRDIIACTVDYAILHYDQFPKGVATNMSHLFVDEAAYCPLAKAGVFFSFMIPVTFLGDHMQLPPVCEMSDEHIISSANSIFMWAQSAIHFPDVFSPETTIDTLYSAFVQRRPPSFQNMELVFLNETYRFGKNLATILDKHVYHSGFSGKGDSYTKITVIDVPRTTKETVFSVSDAEAEAIRAYLLEHPELDDYAIIAPYRKQVFNIYAKLGKNNLSVSTIHSSQGREWNTVIISVVDARRKFFMSSTHPETDGIKIINTAISRAKKEIIFVLDYGQWKDHPDQLLSAIVNSHDRYVSKRSY